jgi:two-component system cell cycle sensor histidine kinase/response regulator CckA
MSPHSVLVVEDERVIARDLQALLQQLGYHVPAIAGTGPDAVASATAHRPDLVLMDIRIQGAMDGIDTAAVIQKQFDVPVVYLTAFADDATRQRARRTAPYGYLVKPFDERTLQATIEMALARHAHDRQTSERGHWLAATLTGLDDAVVTTDAHGQITLLNPAAEQLLRCTQASAIGQAIADVAVLVDARTRAPIEHPVLMALRRQVPVLHMGVVLMTPDGATIPIDSSVVPIRTPAEAIQGAVMVLQNHAAHRPAEESHRAPLRSDEDTRQIERLRALAGGIAHDFNNLLAGVLGNAELARLDLPDESPAHESLAQIAHITQHAADLTRRLRDYAGNVPPVVEPLNLSDLVRQTLLSLPDPTLAHPTIHHQLAPNLPPVEGDPTQLEQVVQNLLVNATEAIGTATGTITVTTNVRQLTSADLAAATVGANRPPGRYVALTIADTGCGMDAETLARIFEPFFTTKFLGRGLGLAAVFGIIREHYGALTVQSAPGAGTTFTLFLPCVTAQPMTALARPAAPAEWHAGGTVLVIDDDDNVRSTTARLLEHLGWAVATAPDGRSGLEVFQAHRYRIDCVLLDLFMPGMHGAEVAHTLRRLNPDIPILVMSGYSEAEITATLVDAARMYVLAKPFQLDDLRQLLYQALHRGGRTHELGG